MQFLSVPSFLLMKKILATEGEEEGGVRPSMAFRSGSDKEYKESKSPARHVNGAIIAAVRCSQGNVSAKATGSYRLSLGIE